MVDKMRELWRVWYDASHNAAENMAIDAVLLESVTKPTLRFYNWSRNAVTIGVAQKYKETKREGFECVRRQTGGGVVDHSNSYTYTVVFPSGHAMTQEDTLACYQQINEAVSMGIAMMNFKVELTEKEISKDVPRSSMPCAMHPTKYDIVNEAGKISGCAQRRNLGGILHQGYIEDVVGDEETLRKYIVEGIRQVFKCDFEKFAKPEEFEARVTELVETQYGNDTWNKKR